MMYQCIDNVRLDVERYAKDVMRYKRCERPMANVIKRRKDMERRNNERFGNKNGFVFLRGYVGFMRVKLDRRKRYIVKWIKNMDLTKEV